MPQPMTIEELRDFWKLQQCGANISVLARYFDISDEYAIECQHACQMLWKPGYRRYRLTQPSTPIPSTETVSLPVPELLLKPANYARPKAEYSNRSPYGIARPGLSRP